jgi:hypothetical protein
MPRKAWLDPEVSTSAVWRSIVIQLGVNYEFLLGVTLTVFPRNVNLNVDMARTVIGM